MTKFIEYVFPTVYAQDGLSANSFRFLDLFGTNDPTGQQSFSALLGRVIGFVLFIAAIIAFAYLVFSGIQYITAGGDAAKAQTARQGIVNALIGIIVIIVSYTVLTFVGNALDTQPGGGGIFG